MARIEDLNVDPGTIRWPVISLDFEASGLGAKTYPIEVGLAVWHGPGTPIVAWSSLISPTIDWLQNGDWQTASEPIHSISREELSSGMAPFDALQVMHRIIGIGGLAFCDGGEHDAYWLRRLAAAADDMVCFGLAPWQLLTNAFSAAQFESTYSFATGHKAPHRAGPDATLNLRGFAAGLGVHDIEVGDLELPQSAGSA